MNERTDRNPIYHEALQHRDQLVFAQLVDSESEWIYCPALKMVGDV